MALDDIFQVNVIHNVSGRETTNIFYYQHTQSGGLSPALELRYLHDAFWARIWDDFWKPCISSYVELVAISCANIWPVLTAGVAQPFDSEFGAIDSDPLPTIAAVLISFKQPDRNRRYYRRCYIPGVAESSTFNSQVTPAAFPALQALAQRLTEDIIYEVGPPDEIWSPRAFSKKDAAQEIEPPYRPIGRGFVQPPIRSQRSRSIRLP